MKILIIFLLAAVGLTSNLTENANNTQNGTDTYCVIQTEETEQMSSWRVERERKLVEVAVKAAKEEAKRIFEAQMEVVKEMTQ